MGQEGAAVTGRWGEGRAAVEPYGACRQPGAVSKLTRALMALVKKAGSADFDAVFAEIEEACHDLPVEGIQFQDCNDFKVWYQDMVTGHEAEITIPNLRRRLTRLPAI